MCQLFDLISGGYVLYKWWVIPLFIVCVSTIDEHVCIGQGQKGELARNHTESTGHAGVDVPAAAHKGVHNTDVEVCGELPTCCG